MRATLDHVRAGRSIGALGIFNMHGTWFIAGNVLRDLASLTGWSCCRGIRAD